MKRQRMNSAARYELLDAEHVALSWKLIEWKVMYYAPHEVHESWWTELQIPDASYEAHERRYLSLCKILGRQNTIVHKGYGEGFDDDADFKHAMMEIDRKRPSVRLVLHKLGKPRKLRTR